MANVPIPNSFFLLTSLSASFLIPNSYFLLFFISAIVRAFMPTEADTCRKFVVPKLQAAGWDNEPFSIAEQRTITDGRIVPVGNKQ